MDHTSVTSIDFNSFEKIVLLQCFESEIGEKLHQKNIFEM